MLISEDFEELSTFEPIRSGRQTQKKSQVISTKKQRRLEKWFKLKLKKYRKAELEAPTFAENKFAYLMELIKAKYLPEIEYELQHVWRSGEDRHLYILDCLVTKPRQVAFEVDGEIHETKKLKDMGRDRELKKDGLEVIRFTNDEVIHERHSTRRRIVAILRGLNNVI